MTKRLIPSPDRIIAKSTKTEATTAGGLLLPPGTERKTTTAVVIAVGTGVGHVAQVGDTVVHVEYGPDKYEDEGEEYLIMREDDVLATIEESA